ncbi:hypothetical protein RIR_jg24541.t1 [Rhizophagus irregularis DAOM 181602=DAOM 197198]|nr:hypothetical protein RIR_jg24541.t1 [Rhizophagus irregularis DAOM 181602=DAOM 197198]
MRTPKQKRASMSSQSSSIQNSSQTPLYHHFGILLAPSIGTLENSVRPSQTHKLLTLSPTTPSYKILSRITNCRTLIGQLRKPGSNTTKHQTVLIDA